MAFDRLCGRGDDRWHGADAVGRVLCETDGVRRWCEADGVRQVE